MKYAIQDMHIQVLTDYRTIEREQVNAAQPCGVV